MITITPEQEKKSVEKFRAIIAYMAEYAQIIKGHPSKAWEATKKTFGLSEEEMRQVTIGAIFTNF